MGMSVNSVNGRAMVSLPISFLRRCNSLTFLSFLHPSLARLSIPDCTRPILIDYRQVGIPLNVRDPSSGLLDDANKYYINKMYT